VSESPALDCQGIMVNFGTIGVLNALSLSVRRREVLGVLGANGAGKSTLLKAVAGVLPVSGGSVLVHGEDVTKLGAAQRVRKGVALIPQGRRVFAPLTVAENVRLGAFTFRGERRRVKDALDRQLEMFPTLRDKWDRPAGTLSGGQQQLVAVARGLMTEPSLIMLDEPSLGVTPDILSAIRGVLESLARDDGAAVIIVEQNVSFALEATSRIVFLRGGQVLYDARSEDVRSDPASVTKLYLGIEKNPGDFLEGQVRQKQPG
jgi:branched-chain amino acid transport system ATP-binding protein